MAHKNMVGDDRLPEYHEAVESAREHRDKASQILGERDHEQDEDKRQSLLTEAAEENRQADEHERRADEILSKQEVGQEDQEHSAITQGPSKPASHDHGTAQQTEQGELFSVDTPIQGEEEQPEQDPTDDPTKRAWYEPGSVADDVLLQVDEATQGSLINNVLEYAARSVFDKEHRSFEGAKMLKSLATAPVTALREAESAARSFHGREQPETDKNPALETNGQGRENVGHEQLESGENPLLEDNEQSRNTADRNEKSPKPLEPGRNKEREHEIGER